MDIQNMHACIQPSQGAAPQSDPAGCSIHDLLDDNDKTLRRLPGAVFTRPWHSFKNRFPCISKWSDLLDLLYSLSLGALQAPARTLLAHDCGSSLGGGMDSMFSLLCGINRALWQYWSCRLQCSQANIGEGKPDSSETHAGVM